VPVNISAGFSSHTDTFYSIILFPVGSDCHTY